MRNRVLLVLLAVALVVSLAAFAACAKEEAPPVEEEWQWPARLLLTASSTNSPSYGALVGWSTPLMKDTGMTIRVILESDSRLQEAWVKEGRFFTKSPHQSRSMMYAQPGYSRRDWGPYQSRVWMPAGVSYWGFTVLGDSPIKTPHDIKPGMKNVLITFAEEPQQNSYALLAWAQVDPEDITFVPVSTTAKNAAMLMDGRIDFALGYHTTPGWYEAEAGPHGLRWIELDAKKDPAGAQRFLDWYPWTSFGVATGGVPTSEGVPMCVNISPQITRAETDPELVYRLVKWCDENYDRFKDSNPWCRTMTIENLLSWAEENYEPIHEGAVRYLKEKGLWTDELEARQQYNIEQLAKWVTAYQTAIGMADDRGIVVNPDNAEWQQLWENYRDSLNLPLLVYFQGPGKSQPSYKDFYDRWNEAKPKF